MGVYVKTLLIAAIVVALATSALVASDAAVLHAPWASVLIVIAGLLIGALVMLALYATRAARVPPALLTGEPGGASDSPAGEPRGGPGARDDEILRFVEQLMAATTSDGLLATVQTQLPPLVGGRNVWLVSELQKRRSPEGAEPATSGHGALMSEVQEWTTFPLRVNDKAVGLLGVESAGGLGADRQQAIRKVTPLLAQAVATVGTIEMFREAGLVDLLTGAATRREGLNRLTS